MRCTSLLIVSLMLLSTFVLGLPDQYHAKSPGGAPMPVAPASPESLGIQVPSPAESFRAPGQQEVSRGLMKTNKKFAYTVPRGQNQKLTAASPAATKPAVPSDGIAQSSLYVSYAPQTVASCYLYANLPLWLQTASSGDVWFYEWYPPPYGNLITTYAGYVYHPGWYKRWFIADVPGWHILQYYCNGWSNYVYIYVYGSGGYWVNPTPNPSPQPYPYPYPYGQGQMVTTYPSTGHTYYSFKSSTTIG